MLVVSFGRRRCRPSRARPASRLPFRAGPAGRLPRLAGHGPV